MRNPGQVMAMLSLGIGAGLTLRLPRRYLGRKMMEEAFNVAIAGLEAEGVLGGFE